MSYSAPSQILARQLEYVENKHILIAGELEDTFAIELRRHAASVSVFSTNYAYANQLKQETNIQVQFGAQYQPMPNIDMLILYWPKAKAEAAYLLTMLLAALGKDTEVVVIGENRSGVKSIEKMFMPYGKITKFDSARRCSFYWGLCQHQPPAFVFADHFKNYQIDTEHASLTIRALPGVFSQKELDVGSALLLNHLTELDGSVFDFGCGAGVIGAVIKTRFPTTEITLADISALAIASAEETLRYNGLTGRVIASDGFAQIDGKFNHIVSNPPFHAGLKTHYAATEKFLSSAPDYLEPTGQLIIVANAFLRYPPFIEAAFGHCNIQAKTKQFVIYQAQKHQ